MASFKKFKNSKKRSYPLVPYVKPKAKYNRLNVIKTMMGSSGINRPELKSVDISAAGAIISSGLNATPALILCNDILAGTGFNQRVGRTVNMKSIHIRGGVMWTNQAGNANGEQVRIALVYDRQPNGATPSYSDIFTSVDLSGNTGSGPLDFTNVNNADRFTILCDEHIVYPSTSIANAQLAQDQTQKVTFDRFVDLKGIPVHYKADAGAAISDIASGALFLVTSGTQAAATAGTAFNWLGRLRYTDN